MNTKSIFPVLAVVVAFFLLVSIYFKYAVPYLENRRVNLLNLSAINKLNDYAQRLQEKQLNNLTLLNNFEPKTIYVISMNTKEVTNICNFNYLPILANNWVYECNSKNLLDVLGITETVDETMIFVSNKKDFCIGIKMQGKNPSQNNLFPEFYITCSGPNLFSEPVSVLLELKMQEGSELNLLDHNQNNVGRLFSEMWKENRNIDFNGENFAIVQNNATISKIGIPNFDYSIVLSFKTSHSSDQSLTEKWIGNTYPFSIRGPFPGVQFAIYDGKYNPVISSNKNYADNNWHQIVAVRDTRAKKIILFIDGLRIGGTIDSTQASLANNGEFPIGARNILGEKIFKGEIKDFVIFNRVLSEQEIRVRYQSQNF